MKRAVVAAACLVLACGFWGAATLPPARTSLQPAPDGTVAGNLHIHTTRSDGRSTPETVAAIAASAGLKFVIFTDHGDGTRPPDPPAYRSGVLCLDGVEISTSGGHLVALDLPVAPYPLAGEARDVIEDVHRLGGFGIAAHPDSPKFGLRWIDWEAPFDGVEAINPDTSWRVLAVTGWAARLQLVNALLHYPFRAGETLAHLLTPIDDTMRHWNELSSGRRVVLLSGADAHAKLATRNAEPGDNRYAVPLPSYEAVFSTLSVHVRTERPLTGDAATDAALLVRAIRAGHLYTAVDGFAAPPSFEFSATNRDGPLREGDERRANGPATLQVRSNAPAAFTTSIWRGAKLLASGHGPTLSTQDDAGEGVYRAEISTDEPGHSQTWLLSNAIYLRSALFSPALSETSRAAATAAMPVIDDRPTGGWHVEVDAEATGIMETGESEGKFGLRLRYALPIAAPSGKSAALVWGPPPGWAPGALAAYDRVTFNAHAERPMRISVQLRALAADGQPRRRWQRSVYVDETDRERTVFFDEMTASPNTSPRKPPLDEANAIMFVIDPNNTKPGASGQLAVSAVTFRK